jgi:hypothetical protein
MSFLSYACLMPVTIPIPFCERSPFLHVFLAVPYSAFRPRKEAGVTIRAVHAQAFENLWATVLASRTCPLSGGALLVLATELG